MLPESVMDHMLLIETKPCRIIHFWLPLHTNSFITTINFSLGVKRIVTLSVFQDNVANVITFDVSPIEEVNFAGVYLFEQLLHVLKFLFVSFETFRTSFTYHGNDVLLEDSSGELLLRHLVTVALTRPFEDLF